MKLYAPIEYWNLTAKEKEKICNGAGPKNWGWLVPDFMWFLKITEAANIHDFDYHEGKTQEDKIKADRVFLNNMLRIIQAKTRWTWLKKLRKRQANVYYEAVSKFGGAAFWSGKNRDNEEREVV